jgi:hypothetical protein
LTNNDLICIVKIQQWHEAAATLNERLLILCPVQTSIAATASGSGNTPEAHIITVGALTARSAAFLFVKTTTL